MSVTGFWIIGVVPSSRIEQLRGALLPFPADGEDLSWWRAMDEAPLAEPEERGFGRHCATDAAQLFSDGIEGCRPDLDQEAWVEALSDVIDEDRFVTSIRKGDPVAALYYGLGFARSRALPGRAGCFLLTAPEVTVAAPTFESALDMSAPRRVQVLDRVRAWLEVVGDAGSEFDAGELIDGPLGIFRRASAQGLGVLGVVCWY